MKNTTMIILLFSLLRFIPNVGAQDVIVTSKNEAIFCKIKSPKISNSFPKKIRTDGIIYIELSGKTFSKNKTSKIQYYDPIKNITKSILRSEVKAALTADNIPTMSLPISISREFKYQRDFYIHNANEKELAQKAVSILQLDSTSTDVFTRDDFLLIQFNNNKIWNTRIWYRMEVQVKDSTYKVVITNLMFQELPTSSNPFPPKKMAEQLILNPSLKAKVKEKYKVSLLKALQSLMFSIEHRLR